LTSSPATPKVPLQRKFTAPFGVARFAARGRGRGPRKHHRGAANDTCSGEAGEVERAAICVVQVLEDQQQRLSCSDVSQILEYPAEQNAADRPRGSRVLLPQPGADVAELAPCRRAFPYEDLVRTNSLRTAFAQRVFGVEIAEDSLQTSQ
jgi:hypothetical protein